MELIIAHYICIVIVFLLCDWRARLVFIAEAYCGKYGHGKSWNRAHKHYKTHWKFWQRICWIPVFKERYDDKFRFLAYCSYFHLTVTLITMICMLVFQFAVGDYELVKQAAIVVENFGMFRIIVGIIAARMKFFEK